MIDIIVSTSMCPHCEMQKTVMKKSFFDNEYRIIEIGTPEFETYDLKDRVDAVPFIVIRDDNGLIQHAAKGTLDGTVLRQIERTGAPVSEEKVFNLKEARNDQATIAPRAFQMSRWMD